MTSPRAHAKPAKPRSARNEPRKKAGPRTRARRITPRLRAHADAVLEALVRAVPEPVCELDHRDGWTLLVATILSAQSTDKMVNKVTPRLFERWPGPRELAAAEAAAVEEVIHPTGFFRAKARSIQGAARVLVERFGGEVPRSMEALTTLPGVARKTANVVLGTAFGIPSGVTVDTHATRVAGRLGLTRETEPERIEADLMALYPSSTWIELGHRLVLHGRYTCTARAPRCASCACSAVCPAAGKTPRG